MGMMLKNIENFKEHHSWKLWNVVHKTSKDQKPGITTEGGVILVLKSWR